MAQRKKDGIRERIDQAALDVFAAKGYPAARISDIAARAGVSVGNIYRYYQNKDEIFYSVLPQSFLSGMQSLMEEKIGACRQGEGGASAISAMADAFIAFMLQNRQRLAILFSGSQGTAYEGMDHAFAGTLLSIVKRVYEKEYAGYISRYGSDEVLELIYKNLIGMYSLLLRLECGPEAVEAQLRQLNLYHFHGITKLLNI